ncbi:MAG: hypothetical protein GXP27_12390 [Planctomycetes bacterium]|nr:hypothetical protein [Planctomycetota bacterium]
MVREYQIAPEWRRTCWLAIVGLAAIGLTTYWIFRFVQNRGPLETALPCLFYAICAVGAALPLRWRLRIDQHGISRRRLGWDLWEWSDFASGRIRKRLWYVFYDPERPWWRRKLDLGIMAAEDRREVIAAINTHYRLPPPPKIPAVLTIRYGLRNSATFSPGGIRVANRGETHDYSWTDLQDAHITRTDPLRRDFVTLVITLPDREIALETMGQYGGASPRWRGATSEEINEYLFRHAPPDRICVSILGESLIRKTHIERKLRQVENTRREFRWIAIVSTPMLLAVLIWMATEEGVLRPAVLGALSFATVGALFIFMFRSLKQNEETLRKNMEQLEGNSEAAHEE